MTTTQLAERGDTLEEMAHSIGNGIVLGDGVCSEGIDILLDLVLKCEEMKSEVFGGDGSRKIVGTKERKLGRISVLLLPTNVTRRRTHAFARRFRARALRAAVKPCVEAMNSSCSSVASSHSRSRPLGGIYLMEMVTPPLMGGSGIVEMLVTVVSVGANVMG